MLVKGILSNLSTDPLLVVRKMKIFDKRRDHDLENWYYPKIIDGENILKFKKNGN